MKKFEAPTITVEEIEIMDVISTSLCTEHENCSEDMGDF